MKIITKQENVFGLGFAYAHKIVLIIRLGYLDIRIMSNENYELFKILKLAGV